MTARTPRTTNTNEIKAMQFDNAAFQQFFLDFDRTKQKLAGMCTDMQE